MSKQLGKTLIKILPTINKKEILTRHISYYSKRNISSYNTDQVISFIAITYKNPYAWSSLISSIFSIYLFKNIYNIKKSKKNFKTLGDMCTKP